jgi:PKD repeat protein
MVMACMIALLCAVVVVPAAATTWNVYEGDSIESLYTGTSGAASDGDTILVFNGTYAGFTIEQSNLTIIGEGADKVTVDSSSLKLGSNRNANGTLIEGFTFTNTFNYVSLGGSKRTSQDCTIRNCIFEGTTGAISTNKYSDNFTFENNIIANGTGTQTFMILKRGYNLLNNTFTDNPGSIAAWYQSSPSTGTISGNSFIRNNGSYYNALFYFSPTVTDSTTTIYLNNFIDNNDNITQYGSTPAPTVYYNSTEPITYTYNGTSHTSFLGNYWGSDYTGVDADGDGIGDTPYAIPGGLETDFDYHPLMGAWENGTIATPSAPVANFVANVTSGDAPLAVAFTDASAGADSWSWTFGDGATSTDQNPVHTYTAAGTYTVTLTVTNSFSSDSATQTITVTESGGGDPRRRGIVSPHRQQHRDRPPRPSRHRHRANLTNTWETATPASPARLTHLQQSRQLHRNLTVSNDTGTPPHNRYHRHQTRPDPLQHLRHGLRRRADVDDNVSSAATLHQHRAAAATPTPTPTATRLHRPKTAPDPHLENAPTHPDFGEDYKWKFDRPSDR